MRQKKTVLAALLLSAFLFGALPAFAQMPKATVHKENVPIKEILALIEKSTDCSFFWNTSDFDAMKTARGIMQKQQNRQQNKVKFLRIHNILII